MPRRPSPPPRRRPPPPRPAKPQPSGRRNIIVISGDDEPQPKRSKRSKRESRAKSNSPPLEMFAPLPPPHRSSLSPSPASPPGSPLPDTLSAAQLAAALEADGARLTELWAAEAHRRAAHPALEAQVKHEEAAHDELKRKMAVITDEIDGIEEEISQLEMKKISLERSEATAKEAVEEAFAHLRSARERVEGSIRQKEDNAQREEQLKERIAAKRRELDGAGERARLVMAGLGMGGGDEDAVATPSSAPTSASSATPSPMAGSSTDQASSTPLQSQSSLASTPASGSTSVSISASRSSPPCTPITKEDAAHNPFLFTPKVPTSGSATPATPATPAPDATAGTASGS